MQIEKSLETCEIVLSVFFGSVGLLIYLIFIFIISIFLSSFLSFCLTVCLSVLQFVFLYYILSFCITFCLSLFCLSHLFYWLFFFFLVPFICLSFLSFLYFLLFVPFLCRYRVFFYWQNLKVNQFDVHSTFSDISSFIPFICNFRFNEVLDNPFTSSKLPWLLWRFLLLN